MATGNMHRPKKTGEGWTCGSGDMFADKRISSSRDKSSYALETMSLCKVCRAHEERVGGVLISLPYALSPYRWINH